MDIVRDIRREVISTTEDSSTIRCTLSCQQEPQCKQAGIIDNNNGSPTCFIFGGKSFTSFRVADGDNFISLNMVEELYSKNKRYVIIYCLSL